MDNTVVIILIKRSTVIGHLDMQGRLAGAFDFLENTNMTVRAESIITCVTQVMIVDDLVKKKRSKSGKC